MTSALDINVTDTHHTVDYSLLEADHKMTILAVDDDIVSMSFLEALIEDLGHDILKAENGSEALTLLNTHHGIIDVVLMDREMPVMDGLTAVHHMKDNPTLRSIPVVMVTGADSTAEMKEGLDAGVFYYLTKPVAEEMLNSVLSAALKEAKQTRALASELSKHRTSFNLITGCKFEFQTLAEAESLSAFMANCFPDPNRVLTGLGEILTNAIEHGNLGIGYEKKSKLIEAKTWRAEVMRLQQMPEHTQKKAVATLARKPDGIYAVIQDCGTGFAWQKYLQIDPSRAGDNHGRGIAQANATSFDRLTYNESGNQAILFVSHEKQLDW